MAFDKLKTTLNRKKGVVILLRHGSTDFNNTDKSEDRIRGWIDVPLNDQGREEADKAGKKLEDKDISLIYASDLKRAKETADIVNKHIGNVPIVVCDDLRPWNLGTLQGEKTSSVLGEMTTYIKNEHKIPPQGESFYDFRRKFLRCLQNIIKIAKQEGRTILLVSHYRNAKLADAWVKAGEPADLSIDQKTMLEDNVNPAEAVKIPVK